MTSSLPSRRETIENIPHFPNGWQEVRLIDVCDVIQGQSPPGSTYNISGEGLPFFQGKAEFGELFPVPVKWCTSPKKIAEKGDVLISIRAPVGPTNICGQKSCIGRGLAAIRPRQNISEKYILYALRATESKLAAKGMGSTFSAINGSDLKNHKLALAPEKQRDKIVAEIEKQFTRLDAGVAALRRVQANLKRYRAAVLKAACEGKLVPTEAELAKKENRKYETGAELFQRILDKRRQIWTGRRKYKEQNPADISRLSSLPVGWFLSTVGELSEVGTGATPKKGRAVYYQDGDIPWVTSSALNKVYVDEASGFVTKEALMETNLTLFPSGTILIAMYGEGKTRGKCAELRIDATTNQAIAAILCPKELRGYIKLCLWQQYEYLRLAASGGVQPNMNLGIVRAICIPLPPISEQVRIVSEAERRMSIADDLETVAIACLNRAIHLRQSILKSAFDGKLKNPYIAS